MQLLILLVEAVVDDEITLAVKVLLLFKVLVESHVLRLYLCHHHLEIAVQESHLITDQAQFSFQAISLINTIGQYGKRQDNQNTYP